MLNSERLNKCSFINRKTVNLRSLNRFTIHNDQETKNSMFLGQAEKLRNIHYHSTIIQSTRRIKELYSNKKTQKDIQILNRNIHLQNDLYAIYSSCRLRIQYLYNYLYIYPIFS